MLVIPAIDLRNKKCVRLLQGKADAETVYADNPVEVAKRWENEGAKLIHVVDLDGAFEGVPQNLDVVAEIVKAVSIPIELGGGIRDLKTIEEILKLGVSRVILGTSAIQDLDMVKEAVNRWGEKICIGIDAKDGNVAVKGWVEDSGIDAFELALKMQEIGVKHIIYTDISRDGMLIGPNLTSLSKMAKTVEINVIASGGVSKPDDIFALRNLNLANIEGVIVGKALYAGTVNLPDVIGN